jgi:hypothetical protein
VARTKGRPKRDDEGQLMEDLFGFEKAIQLDHLNLEQLKELEKILDKIK